MNEVGKRVGGLPCSHQLYAGLNQRTMHAVAVVEASSMEEARERLSKVLRSLELGCWEEVVIVPAEGQLQGVPTFLSGFFGDAPEDMHLH